MANYVVRYGLLRQLGEFSARERTEFTRSAQVIIRTERGVEWGEVLCEANERTREYLGTKGNPGRILREVSPDDERSRDESRLKEQGYFQKARDIIQTRGMSMLLVDIELLFGRERVVLYYTSEARIDFRDLVKQLASELSNRIEMRQMGIRDEAKLQKASLDPNKISGRCGRLKCCLRYEYDVYEEHRRDLPDVGKWVITKSGKGKVLAQEILARKVLVNYEDDRRMMVDADDVLTIVGGNSKAESSAPVAE